MHFVFVLAISLAHLTIVFNYGVSTTDTGTQCSERHSCRNPTVNTTERFCKCDPLCKAYGDCCDDYVKRPGSHQNSTNLQRDVISCKELEWYRSDLREYHYIVDRCPKQFEKGYIDSSCRLRKSSSGDAFAKIPVSGRHSKILYRNFYCATCNGEQDVVFWKGSVYTNSRDPVIDMHQMKFSPPAGQNLRECINAIRKCHSNFRGREVKKRCTAVSQSNSYVSTREGPYYSGEEIYFRNADCAKCNYVNDSRQMCRYEHEGYGHIVFKSDYTILIDFNLGAATTIETVKKYGEVEKEPKNTQIVRCISEQMYDPLKKKCRPLICPRGRKRTSRGCVQVMK